MDNRLAFRPELSSRMMQAVLEKLNAIDARIPEEIKAQVKPLENEFRAHQQECHQLQQKVTNPVKTGRKRKAGNKKHQKSAAGPTIKKSPGKRPHRSDATEKPSKSKGNETTAADKKRNKRNPGKKGQKAPTNSSQPVREGVRKSMRKNKGISAA